MSHGKLQTVGGPEVQLILEGHMVLHHYPPLLPVAGEVQGVKFCLLKAPLSIVSELNPLWMLLSSELVLNLNSRGPCLGR